MKEKFAISKKLILSLVYFSIAAVIVHGHLSDEFSNLESFSLSTPERFSNCFRLVRETDGFKKLNDYLKRYLDSQDVGSFLANLAKLERTERVVAVSKILELADVMEMRNEAFDAFRERVDRYWKKGPAFRIKEILLLISDVLVKTAEIKDGFEATMDVAIRIASTHIKNRYKDELGEGVEFHLSEGVDFALEKTQGLEGAYVAFMRLLNKENFSDSEDYYEVLNLDMNTYERIAEQILKKYGSNG